MTLNFGQASLHVTETMNKMKESGCDDEETRTKVVKDAITNISSIPGKFVPNTKITNDGICDVLLNIKDTGRTINEIDDIYCSDGSYKVKGTILSIMINYNHFCMNKFDIDISDVEFCRKIYERTNAIHGDLTSKDNINKLHKLISNEEFDNIRNIINKHKDIQFKYQSEQPELKGLYDSMSKMIAMNMNK